VGRNRSRLKKLIVGKGRNSSVKYCCGATERKGESQSEAGMLRRIPQSEDSYMTCDQPTLFIY
jgi:hypothetical protein